MSVEFDINKQVVCIDDDWTDKQLAGERFPYHGEILTIREIVSPDDLSPLPADAIFFRFVEIVNPATTQRVAGEVSFHSIAFRPVRKTDISIFTELLVTPPLELEVVK